MRIDRRVWSVFVVAVLLCTGFPAAAIADSGPVYYSAGVLVPTTSNDVRMTREVLTIDYTNQTTSTPDHQSDYVHVHARFWFRNEGKAVTQQMGFPMEREWLSGFGIMGLEFKVTMDGTAVKAFSFDQNKNTAGGSELAYDQWMIYRIPFAAGQSRLIDVTYSILPRGGYFLYVLQTGRLWKGPIGDLTIDVNLGREAVFPDLLSVQPAGYHTRGNHILWHFTNYEPEQDIEIESMFPSFWETVRPLKQAAERTGTEADWYRYAVALLPDTVIGSYPGDTAEIGGPYSPLGFVRGLQTSAYADYVQRTLLTALNHATHGSAEARVLRAAYDARFSYYEFTGDFLNGVDQAALSIRAHSIYQELLTAGMSLTKPSPEEKRLLPWLTIAMAGESMAGDYSLSAIHELDQSRAFAQQAGVLDSLAYQNMMKSVLDNISSYTNPRLLVGVSIVPRVEIQQQKMDIYGGPAWRARIILHQTLPPSEMQAVKGFTTSSQPDWKTMPAIDSTTGLVQNNNNGLIECGFSDKDPNDYLVVLTLSEARNTEESAKIVTTAAHGSATSLMYTKAYSGAFDYPADAMTSSSMQSSSCTWLQAIAPTIKFDINHGFSVTLSSSVPMSNALCDKADAELKTIFAAYGTLPWAKDYEIDTTLQHNLDLVEQTRGKNPSVTIVTYAADGTVSKTVTTQPAGKTRGTLWIVLAGIGGLVAGLLLGMLLTSRHFLT
ncbi:MAG: hypothetical protein ACYDH4_06840 [Candidatus Cryosericum sp.]